MESGNRPLGQTPTTSHETHRPAVHTSPVRRHTDETKHAFKTTEFMLTVATIAGILIAALLINDDNDAGDTFIASQAWLYVAIVVVGYNIGRGAAKSGSYAEDTDDHR